MAGSRISAIPQFLFSDCQFFLPTSFRISECPPTPDCLSRHNAYSGALISRICEFDGFRIFQIRNFKISEIQNPKFPGFRHSDIPTYLISEPPTHRAFPLPRPRFPHCRTWELANFQIREPPSLITSDPTHCRAPDSRVPVRTLHASIIYASRPQRNLNGSMCLSIAMY